MNLITAFFKLIRWPNLFFIALTQWLFYHCIVLSLEMNHLETFIPFHFHFLLLMMASVFIAAAGYIINDYFDLQIDIVNKPEKVVVDKTVKRRWAIMLHILFSIVGIILSGIVSYYSKKWVIVLGNIGTVLLLWIYSTRFKKKLLIGNIVIAALTGWVILVVYFYAGATLINYKGWTMHLYPYDIKRLFKLTVLYVGFAFVLSLIREVVKDLEDMYGDAQFNCQTMPIVLGVPATKVFVAVWIVVCVLSLLVVQLYAWQLGWWISSLYAIFFIVVPLLWVLKNLFQASAAKDYHRLSIQLKVVMLAGILSMLFFKIL